MAVIWCLAILGVVCIFTDYISAQITIEVCPQPSRTVGGCLISRTTSGCSSNLQCKPGSLCCLEGCGRVCKPALTIRQQTRSGFCPVPPSLAVACFSSIKHSCRMDIDCKRNMKCCSHPCGSRCLNPNPQSRMLKSGTCPAQERMSVPSCVGSMQDRCKSDRDCDGDLKCCIHPCGLMCLTSRGKTILMKPGLCPMPHESFCNLPRRDHCASDADCHGLAKCCRHPCGRSCIPILTQFPTRKKNVIVFVYPLSNA